jgi:hypothetical protein
VRHMSYISESYLPAGKTLGSRASCGPMWAAGLKHEERPSRPACAVRLICSQRTRAHF